MGRAKSRSSKRHLRSLAFQLAKVDVLILDGWDLITPDGERRRDLLEILDDRYQKRSTIVTSQLSLAHWHDHLNDPSLADAILGRLLHNAFRIEMDANTHSMRKYHPLQTEKG